MLIKIAITQRKGIAKEEYCGGIRKDEYTNTFTPNEIEIYEYEFITSYKVEEYGITWWMKEEVE